MRNTVKITTAQLIEMLMNWNLGSQPATVQYATTPKINKDGKSVFGDLLKLGAVNCMIGYNYAKSVNNQRTREGKEADFEVEPLWKGKGIHLNSRIVKHIDTGVLYLSYKHERTLKSLHFDAVLNFIPSAMLKPYFYKSSKPQKQGVEEVVKPRTLKIENIRRLKFKKVTYEIVKA